MQRYSYQGLSAMGIGRQAKPCSIPYFFFFQSLNKISMVLEPNLFLAKH